MANVLYQKDVCSVHWSDCFSKRQGICPISKFSCIKLRSFL